MGTATRARLLCVKVQQDLQPGNPVFASSTVAPNRDAGTRIWKVLLDLAPQRNGKSDPCAQTVVELAGIHALAGCELELCLSPAGTEEA